MTEKEKIMISDMLFFFQNAIHSKANDDIIKICDTFYIDDEPVWQEKERFSSPSEKKP